MIKDYQKEVLAPKSLISHRQVEMCLLSKVKIAAFRSKHWESGDSNI